MPAVTFSLVLKLAAASLSGVAFLLSWQKARRDDALFRLRREIHRHSGVDPPPSVLVLGFRSHGKSSFINTVCRVLAWEEGPMLLRTETAPAGSPAGMAVTRSETVVPVVVTPEGEAAEEVTVLEMIDTPGFSGDGEVRDEVDAAIKLRKSASAVECVVVVMRCPGMDSISRKSAARKLEEIAAAIRENGLLMVIVVTHKSSISRWNARQIDELRDEIAVAARTDSIYIMDSYTVNAATGHRHLQSVNNTFDTHVNALAIVRQCMEFAALHRAHHKRQAREVLQPVVSI